jgi:signal peptidase I
MPTTLSIDDRLLEHRDARAARRYRARASHVGLVCLVLLSTGGVLQPIRVEGGAMEPTLGNGDRAFATRVFAQLERGDVVAVKYPRNESKSFVMRIVGLPGERIEMANGTVSINGRTIDDSYVHRDRRSSDTWGSRTIPEGEYFMMGDNRRNSSDSRTWGTVRRDLIWAKVVGR